MDFTLDEEQLAARQTAREVLGKRSKGELGDALWQDFAHAGLAGLTLARDVGGGAQGMVALCLVLEEVGRSLAQVPLLPALVAAQAVDRFGSPAQRARWLPETAGGHAVLSLGITDGFGRPGAATVAGRQVSGGWVLDGEQPFVPHAAETARVLLPVRAGEQTLMVLLDPRLPGVEAQEQQTTSGTTEILVRPRGVTVSDADVVGPVTAGEHIRQWTWQRATTGTCAVLVGLAAGALEMAADYAGKREQFGRAIGTFQAVAGYAANALIDVEAMRVTTWQAAWRLDAGLLADREVAIAKFWASEGATRVTGTAQHLHGGIGLATNHLVNRYFTRARQLGLAFGTAPWHLSELGRIMAAAPGVDHE